MKPAFRFCLFLALATTLGNAAAEGRPALDTPAQVIARLEKHDTPYLYDMHGNVNDDLQQLMTARFDATHTVMDSIDRLRGDPGEGALQEALYRVLGFVKDPASIGWLRAKLQSDQAQEIHDYYLPQWHTRLDGFGSWEWLTDRQDWISFWQDAYSSESLPGRRATLLRVLAQFDDSHVIRFFEVRRTTASDPREILVVESYLAAHDRPPDGKRILAAVNALAERPENCAFLVKIAHELRHEAFVPFLVEVADIPEKNVTPTSYPAQRALRSITFELDVDGKDAWSAWFAAHTGQTREQWKQQVLDSFLELLQRNPAEAQVRFERSVYYWNDIALVPFIASALAARPEFHNAIAGWINLTYTDFHRQRLRGLADRISRHPQRLQDWARRLLQARGYVPGGGKYNWAETVRYANMAM